MELHLEIPQVTEKTSPADDESAGFCFVDFVVDFSIEESEDI